MAVGSLGPVTLDLVVTLKELPALGVGFMSLTEALDLTTPAGRPGYGRTVVCVC